MRGTGDFAGFPGVAGRVAGAAAGAVFEGFTCATNFASGRLPGDEAERAALATSSAEWPAADVAGAVGAVFGLGAAEGPVRAFRSSGLRPVSCPSGRTPPDPTRAASPEHICDRSAAVPPRQPARQISFLWRGGRATSGIRARPATARAAQPPRFFGEHWRGLLREALRGAAVRRAVRGG